MRPTPEKLAREFDRKFNAVTGGHGCAEMNSTLACKGWDALARLALELIPDGGPTEAEREAHDALLAWEATRESGVGVCEAVMRAFDAAKALRAERAPKPRFWVEVRHGRTCTEYVLHDRQSELLEARAICQDSDSASMLMSALNAAHERGELP